MINRLDSYTVEMRVMVDYSVPNPNKTGEDMLLVTWIHFCVNNCVDAGAARNSLAASPAAHAAAAELPPDRLSGACHSQYRVQNSGCTGVEHRPRRARPGDASRVFSFANHILIHQPI